MASSNRHWPSMFRSKPHNNQWQHDINSSLLPSSCQRSSPFTSSGCEERSPEPKPRWNPKPEQIRILEAIFNSGMVNPPRDEIRRIRAQLQEYGQVGDANVFYWFQNRKSRSKHKLRLLHNSKQTQSQPQSQLQPNAVGATSVNSPSPSSSSSSSSPKCAKSMNNDSQLPSYKKKNANSSSGNNVNLSLGSSAIQKGGVGATSVNNPTTVVTYPAVGHHHCEFPGEPPAFLFPVSAVAAGGGGGSFDHHNTTAPPQLGFGSTGEMIMSNVIHHHPSQAEITQEHHVVGPCTSLLLSEIMNVNYGSNLSDKEHDDMRMKMLQQTPICCYSTSFNSPTNSYTNMAVPCLTSASVTVPSTSNHLQVHVQEPGAAATVGAGERVVVFINEMAFEVGPGRFNVKEAFGEEAVLINSSGQPLLTDEWGLSLQPLRHGASYYLI